MACITATLASLTQTDVPKPDLLDSLAPQRIVGGVTELSCDQIRLRRPSADDVLSLDLRAAAGRIPGEVRTTNDGGLPDLSKAYG